MNSSELEYKVKKEFGMTLHEFIVQKTSQESLYDYEIAEILDATTWQIRRYRNGFGIKKANAFPRRFERTYGKGAMGIFKKIVGDPDSSLADAGRHFGFTREYARYVYRNIYGRTYSEAFLEKKIIRKKRMLSRKRHRSQRISYLMEVMGRMRSMGIISEILDSPQHLIKANGYNLSIKIAKKPAIVGKKQYFLFRNGRRLYEDVDFFICLCKNGKEFIHYIIPANVMPKSGISILHQEEACKGKYSQFGEAWYQLVSDELGGTYKAQASG